MRALFVDDEVEFLELMEKRLTRRGMEVVTAPDGQSALDLLDQALQSGEMFQIVVMVLPSRETCTLAMPLRRVRPVPAPSSSLPLHS